jgi:hypothetical protein
VREPSRLGVILLVVVALVIGLAGDHLLGHGSSVAGAVVAAPGGPAVPPADSLSSTWFCPALGASAGSQALGRIIVGDPTSHGLSGTLTLTPSQGNPVVDDLLISPFSRSTFKLEDLAPGAFAATTVSLDEPGGAVEQEVTGPLGQSISPCATASSDTWYFPSGHTDTDATELISLYNPYPAAAIADLDFATDIGPTTPEAFQGIVIPPNGFNVIDIGTRVRIRAAVATRVHVRAGRLVVDEIEVQPSGLALTLGAPTLSTHWYYPGGITGGGVDERFDVYNPGTSTATVSLIPVLASGSADPFSLTIDPDDRVSLEIDQQSRIPPGVGQAWLLASTNGVPVSATQVSTSTSAGLGTGVALTIGAPGVTGGWVFPAGSSTNGGQESLLLFNPGGRAARVTVTVSGNGASRAVSVPPVAPESAVVVNLDTADPAGVLIVEVLSDQPIVAGREQGNAGGQGFSSTVGIIDEG